MKPALVLLAGMLNDDRIWQPVAQILQDRGPVRLVHFPNHSSMAAMAEHAWASIADIPREQPLALAGFSMGGYVLQQMLATAPRPVQAVALVDSAVRPETQDSRASRLKTLQAIERDFPGLVDQVARWGTHPGRHHDTAFMEGIRCMLREVGAQTAARQTQAIADRADHRDLMRELKVPVQIVCGRQDKVTPPELSQEAADLMTNARLDWLEDCGHMTPLERTADLAAILGAWLDRIKTDGSTGETP